MFDKTTENKNKIFELYPENQELVLLDKLSHEFQNFRSGFRGKLDHTYVLSPAASDMFPVTIHNGKPIMGVPDQLFEIFLDIRWYVVNILEGMNSLYLTFEIGVAPKNILLPYAFTKENFLLKPLVDIKEWDLSE